MGFTGQRLRRHPTTAGRSGSLVSGRFESPHDAFQHYVVPELGVLHRVALTLTRRPADAEDLVQETMLRAFRAIDRFDGRYPRSWLMAIMRHINVTSYRRRTRGPVMVQEPGDAFDRVPAPASADTEPETAMMQRSFDDAVRIALAAFPIGFEQVIELVDVDGLSYEEAATLLGIPIGTVMSRLHRGRARLRARLGDEYFTKWDEG